MLFLEFKYQNRFHLLVKKIIQFTENHRYPKKYLIK